MLFFFENRIGEKMITLSNGHSFEYMIASGVAGIDGTGWPLQKPFKWLGLFDPSLFTVVAKTLTLKPIKASRCEVLKRIRPIKNGVVNNVGLVNPGIDWWAHTIGPKVDSSKIPLIVSIFGTPQELREMAIILNEFDLVGIEINTSCPNTTSDFLKNADKVVECCKVVKEVSRLPIILKLSVAQDVWKIMQNVKGIVEAISINSVPWLKVFPYDSSPFGYNMGGVSGKAAQAHNWALVRSLSQMTNIPVIGPSVWDFEDMKRVRNLGAKAISFGSVFLRYPWRPTQFVKQDMKKEVY